MPYIKVVTFALLALSMGVLSACADPKAPMVAAPSKAVVPFSMPMVQATPGGKRVLVVINQTDPDSVRLGRYYAEKRGVPRENVVLVQTTAAERIPLEQYEKEIHDPIKAALAKTKNPIDFILLMRGLPLRNAEGFGISIDSRLMADSLPTQKAPVASDQGQLAENPYFNKKEPFSHAKFGIYLVCRLDGYTFEDAKALVDNSLAAKPNPGPFLLNKAQNRKSEGYGELQATLDSAATLLKAKGLDVTLDEGVSFPGSSKPLAGYATWGSNDGAFKQDVYAGLKFLPGAICETFVSTSGRSFRKPVPAGQSVVADLIAQGVTGVKGYVSEPYTFALAKADILFDRYTSGYNLAESFYAASAVTHWRDIVIGDPLCAPYKK